MSLYCIAEKFGGGVDKFGKSSVIYQIKTIQIGITLLSDLLICQTFSTKYFEKIKFANLLPIKLFHYMVLKRDSMLYLVAITI